MSTSEPRTQQPPKVDAVVQPTFASVWRGFDPEQVQRHVKGLEDRVRTLESELQQAREGGPSVDPYAMISNNVADLVRSFDQDVERMRRQAEADARNIREQATKEASRGAVEAEASVQEARAEAEQILAQATVEADRIRIDAQATAEEARAQADRILDDRRRELDRVLVEQESRRSILADEIAAMRPPRLRDGLGSGRRA